MANQEQQQDSTSSLPGRVAPGLAAFSRYEMSWLPTDIGAGLSVGIAYSAIADVPAVSGIYAAIFPLFAYALFGSSRQLIVGPDAATIPMVAAAIQKIDQLRDELADRDIEFGIARKTSSTERFFEGSWVNAREELTEDCTYPTLKSAIHAFEERDNRRSRRGKRK